MIGGRVVPPLVALPMGAVLDLEITTLEVEPNRVVDLEAFCDDVEGAEEDKDLGFEVPRLPIGNFLCCVVAYLPIFPLSLDFDLTDDCLFASGDSVLSAVTPSNGNPF